MLLAILFVLPLCSGLINTGFFRVNIKSVFKMNGADDYANYLDKNNLEKLEKLFNMQNRRYSPYNKNTYKREINKITHNITDKESYDIGNVISKKMVEDINEEIMNAFREQIDEAHSNLNENNDNDDIDSRQSGKKKNGENNGFFDDMGVFRYKDPKMFLPDSARKGSDNDDFDSGSQFQIVKQSPYSFKDVGGYSEVKEELLQTSDILINYEKYRKYNVRTPKGIIFEGPPGNGKTLMAKGFCGEINVTFIPVSGSEFSEKYVGVGASRVRELFKLANDHRPCVIFIDEIDALARKRGNDMVSSNSEKDQTLNQLLINLDGFKDSNGVFVIGATNRLDLLDPALIRAGRMDKNIFIGNPDSATRRIIIDIHLSGKPLHPSVKMDHIVEMTGGFSGAQIENLLNESMLRALRENREIITFDDLEFIANRILSGWQSTQSKFSDDIIDRIVIHEMGHALVGYFSKDHPKLVKVCLNTCVTQNPRLYGIR
jgi:ATP-dependent Zn protease